MNKLDLSLDDVIAGSHDNRQAGGRAPKVRGRQQRLTGRTTPYERPAEQLRAPGEGFKNHGGFDHLSGMTLDDIANAPADQRVLKVGQNSNPKTVAGSISYVTRSGGPPALLSLGNNAVNQAIKSVAIATKYMAEEYVNLVCAPVYRDEKFSSVSLVLQEAQGMTPGRGPGIELLVATSTDPRTLAGAIAGKVREGEKHFITAMGVDCVAIMVYAVAYAREYLADEGLECCCVPEFIHVQKDGEEKSAMQLKILWKAGHATKVERTKVVAPPAVRYTQEVEMRGSGGGFRVNMAKTAASNAMRGIDGGRRPMSGGERGTPSILRGARSSPPRGRGGARR